MLDNDSVNLEDYELTRTLDSDRLAHAFNIARGNDRTTDQFAKEIGLSQSKCSRIRNGNITRPLKKDVLERIAEHADPSVPKETILLQLLKANGMTEKPKDDATLYNYQDLTSHFDAEFELMSLSGTVKETVAMSLLGKGYAVKVIDHIEDTNDSHIESGFMNNLFVVQIMGHKPEEIQFHIYATLPINKAEWPDEDIDEIYDFEATEVLRHVAINFLVDSWEPERYMDTRHIYVLNDKKLYSSYKKLLETKTVNGEMSVILVDSVNKTVEEEWQIPRKTGEVVEPLFK